MPRSRRNKDRVVRQLRARCAALEADRDSYRNHYEDYQRQYIAERGITGRLRDDKNSAWIIAQNLTNTLEHPLHKLTARVISWLPDRFANLPRKAE